MAETCCLCAPPCPTTACLISRAAYSATGSPAAVGLFVIGIIFGGICAAICGLIIGVPALRLKGDYLAIITLGFAEIIRVVMQNIDGVLGFTLTGGAKGLTGIPSYTNFLNTFIVVAISLFLIHTMMKSRHGRAQARVLQPKPARWASTHANASAAGGSPAVEGRAASVIPESPAARQSRAPARHRSWP